MIAEIRHQFNQEFTEDKYRHFLHLLQDGHPDLIAFKTAETPVFISKEIKDQLLEACADIWEMLSNDELKIRLRSAVPLSHFVPAIEYDCEMFSFDFGICADGNGGVIPQLIELQGFPTMFYWQAKLDEAYRAAYHIPAGLTNYFNGYTEEKYLSMLKDLILNGHDPENVVLLDIKPETQKTAIDFALTYDAIGVKAVCVSALFEESGNVYYMNEDGQKIHVKRIYNRMIFDEFDQFKSSLPMFLDITKPLKVEWLPHPNWFYQISKYALPFLAGKYVPDTYFLTELPELPTDLENYVLKPLFSFAGQGVVIDVTPQDIEALDNPGNWILQKKKPYAPFVETPDGKAMCELRLMFFIPKGEKKPILVNNLARLSKGKMVGVRYNADKTWVGSSIAYFEE